MRVAIEGRTVSMAPPRLLQAARGLERRGHDVTWWGAALPDEPGLRPGAAADRVAGADVVIGADAPARVARMAWGLRAQAMILGATAARVVRWGWVERWAWDSVHAMALIEESDADAVREGARGLPLERFALWPPGVAPPRPDVTHGDVELLERACERALARSRGPGVRAAAFVDRDGTLVEEHGYLSDPAALRLLPGVAAALRETRAAGHPVVVISNQAGVGRGRYPLERAYATMARLRVLLRAEGVELDAIHFCPHAPDAGCACRKPGTLLIERAADDLQIALTASVMVGDKRLDAAAGRAAGMSGVLVRTGYGRDEEAASGEGGEPPAERVFDDLAAALRWFCEREDGRVAF
jgi:histidinol-phosphate phosphatase family protein